MEKVFLLFRKVGCDKVTQSNVIFLYLNNFIYQDYEKPKFHDCTYKQSSNKTSFSYVQDILTVISGFRFTIYLITKSQ